MRVANRNDLVLLGGLAVAVFVVFSRRIAEVIDYAHEIDSNRGLQLMPALVILTGVLIVHLVRKRQEMRAAARQATERAEELQRLVEFSQALARSLDLASIKAALSSHLPTLVPGRRLWASSDALHMTEPPVQSAELRFPMIVGSSRVGAIGAAPVPPLTDQERGVIVTAAALLGVSIRNAELFQEVHESSVRDALTGCFRRKHALAAIETELRRAQRSRLALSMIMFDLDHFKDVNDHYGHLCGDAVLAWIGQRLDSVLRGRDVKCRYGGEEFLIVLPESPLTGAMRVADTLRRSFSEHPIAWEDTIIAVTASFGITEITPGETEVAAIIARADAALYRAKEEGRNCVRTFEELTLA
jgi:diguanylate cyclase (GGDEF)-like protein